MLRILQHMFSACPVDILIRCFLLGIIHLVPLTYFSQIAAFLEKKLLFT